MAVVATLRVVPVKGLGSVTRQRVRVERDGVAEDRRVFLLDDAGSVVTLRSAPGLVRLTPDLDLERAVLSVELADGTRASSSLHDVTEVVRAHLYGKDRVGHVLPGDVAEALSAAAGQSVRVVVGDRPGVGWDEGPVSIISRASARAVDGGRDTARYRMLVELDDTQAYEEDGWVGHDVALGDAVVRVTHQLERCVIITQSPATGATDWEGLQALAQTRGRDQLCLGVIAEVVQPGHVTVGSPVRLADRS